MSSQAFVNRGGVEVYPLASGPRSFLGGGGEVSGRRGAETGGGGGRLTH